MQIIHNSSEALRADVLKNRDEIRDRKAFNATKRKEIAAAKQELTRRETADIAPVTKIIGRLQSRWDVLHTRTAESRLLLCKEAAALCGLQKHRKRDTKPKADTYIIGGLPIFHLRELNSEINAFILNPLTGLIKSNRRGSNSCFYGECDCGPSDSPAITLPLLKTPRRDHPSSW